VRDLNVQRDKREREKEGEKEVGKRRREQKGMCEGL